MLKLFTSQVENLIINNILPDFYNILLSTENNVSEKNLGAKMFNNLLKNCSYQMFEKIYPEILKIYLKHIPNLNSEDFIDYKLYLIEGIGIFAQRADNNGFSNFIVENL